MSDMDERRSFEVETPLGKLLVYAKHATDAPQNYPGVFIDFLVGSEPIPLACVEYNSAKELLQTCVYGDGLTDVPTDVVEHQNLILDEEE